MRAQVLAGTAAALCALTTPGMMRADDPGLAEPWSQCVSLENDQARLACYDVAAGRQRSAAGAGKWVISEDVNPVDDTKTVMAMLQSVEGRLAYGAPVALFVRCKSNVIEVFISWGQYLGDDTSHRAKQKNVIMRIGGDEAFQRRWGVSTDGKVTFYPRPIELLKSAAAADQLVFRLTPFSSTPITATFAITGMAETLTPVMATCGYPPLTPWSPAPR